MSGDVAPDKNKSDWNAIMTAYETNVGNYQYTGAQTYSDPDILCVGMSGMVLSRAITQMSLWSIMMAPMILGADIRSFGVEALNTVTNAGCIAVN